MAEPSARDRAVLIVHEALAEAVPWGRLPAAEVAVDALLADPGLLAGLAGVPHPGVEALLARCDDADRSARCGSHTPASWGVGLLSTTAIRALLGHTTDATLNSELRVAPDTAPGGEA